MEKWNLYFKNMYKCFKSRYTLIYNLMKENQTQVLKLEKISNLIIN